MSDLKEKQVKSENVDTREASRSKVFLKIKQFRKFQLSWREVGTSSLEVSNSAGQEILLVHQMSKMKMTLVDFDVNILRDFNEIMFDMIFKRIVMFPHLPME